MRTFQINTLALVLAFMASSVVAQGSVPVIPTEAQAGKGKLLYPWQAAQSGQGGDAYFVNLGNGDKIETPFLVKFGLSGGWGLAPISKASSGKSGHHHLLVNRDLPLDFKQALPFTEQYIHFGKGQMETVLNLAPGTYKLRLLLADDKHIPHFVYSKPLNITVSKKTTTDPKTLVKPGVEMLVANGEQKRPFRVQFHASGDRKSVV